MWQHGAAGGPPVTDQHLDTIRKLRRQLGRARQEINRLRDKAGMPRNYPKRYKLGVASKSLARIAAGNEPWAAAIAKTALKRMGAAGSVPPGSNVTK